MARSAAIQLSASLEDYLEAILGIVREKQAARAKDIGKAMKVNRSSVTGALHALADRELINYAPYDLITLTDKGRAVAEEVARRHAILRDFFVKVLAVEAGEADEAACKLEHAVSETIVERFVEFVEFVERCPRGGSKWIKGFGYFCDNDRQTGNCEHCVQLVLDEVRSDTMSNATPAGSPGACDAPTTGRARGAGDDAATTTLAELRPGQRGAIVKVAAAGALRRRLLDMGATSGAIVEVERIAPLGDPMDIRVKGYHLSLRKQEAGQITIRPL